MPAKPRLKLRVTASAESALRRGHPWVYAESIREQSREGDLGELAILFDRQDRFLALGLFDPNSPLRVRILHMGKPEPVDRGWWERRLEQTVKRRTGLFDDETTGFRWIHGESDGWPGLVLDRYAATLVLKLYTGAWFPRLDELLDLFGRRLGPERIVLRLSRNIAQLAAKSYGFQDGQIVSGPPLDGPVLFQESGFIFEADVLRGQKTGFFLDQRENRRLIESLAHNRDVLNAFSFSGGFSLYAARGGARSVTDIDISSHALESARRHFVLNRDNPKIAACRHGTIQADAFDWLSEPQRESFDLIILDPPSLAKREAERSRAIQAYGSLASHALKRLRSRGILMACSCSAHVSGSEFFQTIRRAAERDRRRFNEIRTTGHPPDHPATFPEAEYLKCIFLKF